MDKINYDLTILSIQCCRKHLILDTKYTVYLLPGYLILSSNQKDQNPKYRLQLGLTCKIHWITRPKTSIIEQFGIKHQEKVKYFFGTPTDLQRLKDCMQGQLMYKDISDFYQPLSLLGKGGSAKVYMVTKRDATNEKFASKCVDKKYLQEDGGYNALFNEILLMQKLKHKNIIQLIDLYEGENTFYMILEYLAGQSLHELLNRRQTILEPSQIQTIMKHLLEAVAYMHEQKVMHRDLKPENIMFKYQNQFDTLKIVDFGLAAALDMEEYPFPKCGTPGYVAPEIANLKDLSFKYDVICDEFSVGCIFYKLCTCKELFPGNEYSEILKLNKKCHLNLDSLAIYKTHSEACDLIQQLLKINPKERITAQKALAHPYFTTKLETKKSKFQTSHANKFNPNPLSQTQNFNIQSRLDEDDNVEDEHTKQLFVPVMHDMKSIVGISHKNNIIHHQVQATQPRRNFKKCQTQDFEEILTGMSTQQNNNYKPSLILNNEVTDHPHTNTHKHNTLIKNFPQALGREQMGKIEEDLEENIGHK